jgi:hypothetical protein
VGATTWPIREKIARKPLIENLQYLFLFMIGHFIAASTEFLRESTIGSERPPVFVRRAFEGNTIVHP